MRFIDRLIVLVLSLALLALGAGAIWLCFDYQGSIVAVSDWLRLSLGCIDWRGNIGYLSCDFYFYFCISFQQRAAD